MHKDYTFELPNNYIMLFRVLINDKHNKQIRELLQIRHITLNMLKTKSFSYRF